MEENDETTRYELKEKVSFSYILMDRVLTINRAFDFDDRQRLRASLISLYDNLTPYLTEEQRKPIEEKADVLIELLESAQKDEFLIKAHLLFRVLLLEMRDLKLLTKEVRVDTY